MANFKTKLRVLLLLSGVSQSTFSMENEVTNEENKNSNQIIQEDVKDVIKKNDINTIPVYEGLSLEKQIDNYRKIYDTVLLEDSKKENNLNTVPIKGLFGILRNGFSLVSNYIDYIEKNTKMKSNSKNWQEKMQLEMESNRIMSAKSKLKDLYEKALEKEENNGLTQYDFLDLNKSLAEIVDVSKGNSTNWTAKWAYNDSSLFSNSSLFDTPFNPPMVLYNIDTSKAFTIPMSTFIDQALGSKYKYGASVFAFDVTLVQPPKGNKKDPHYSKWNTTGKMFWHDGEHIRETATLLENLKENGINWAAFLRDLDKVREIYDVNSNKYNLMTAALFIMHHEMLPIIDNDISSLYKDSFIETVNHIKTKMISFVEHDRQDEFYREFLRDFESIIKGIHDKKGNPLLPNDDDWKKLKDKEKKQKAVVDAYTRFWDSFLSLTKDSIEEFDKRHPIRKFD